MDRPAALTSGAFRRPRWLVPVAVVGGLFLLLVLPLIGTYNGLVDRETAVDQSFADLDVQLQRRADLIPNAVSTARAALNQEQEVFGELARARAAYSGARTPEEKLAAGAQIESGLGRLLVIVENYPQLQSNQNLRDLQVQLEGTENRIAQSRRQYNAAVTDYNRSIRRFPRNLAAGVLGFDRRPLFGAEAGARDVPEVDLESSPSAP